MCRHDDPPKVIAETVGRPLPGVEVRVVDDDGKDAPIGEFLVRGFNVMKGYFNNPEATAEAIDADGWLKTGDVGLIDDGGNLRITDRKKDMFIVGGFNAYPAEIEGALVRHPGVSQAAVIGVPDARMGEVGCAFVVPRPGTDAGALPEELVAWSRDQMANYKVPRHIEVIEALPTNASGKVLKTELRERFAQRPAKGA
jgi:acyl-CoA synthetase (AMP-forming)/AMP-acid ligase II